MTSASQGGGDGDNVLTLSTSVSFEDTLVETHHSVAGDKPTACQPRREHESNDTGVVPTRARNRKVESVLEGKVYLCAHGAKGFRSNVSPGTGGAHKHP